MQKYDVLVIGAGPAGLTAAYILNKKGLNVAILEKRKFPRDKLCGGLLTLKTVKLLEKVFDLNLRILKRNNVINYSSNFYEVYYRKNRIIRAITKYTFYFTSREKYDYLMYKVSKKAGVDIYEAVRVHEIDTKNKIVKTNFDDFKYSYLIGADGATSLVRGFIISQKDIVSWKKDLAIAFEIFVKKDELNSTYDCPTIYLGYLKYGYGWIFPNKNRYVVGLGGITKNNKDILQRFILFLKNISLDLKNVQLNAFSVPFGCFVRKPVKNNIFLVGDAAGFAHPITGEGIYYAHKSGVLVANAICSSIKKRKKPESLYIEYLRKEIYPEFIYAKKLRSLIYNMLKISCISRNTPILKILGHKLIPYIHHI